MQSDITNLLSSLSEGNEDAAGEVLSLLYDELKTIAKRTMQDERANHTLQPTALVHEAFLRMRDLKRIQWQGKQHFCAVAAGVMRRVLIDYARRRSSEKRGKGMVRFSLQDVETPWDNGAFVDLLIVDDALKRLEALNQRHAQVVEMRVFAGLSIAETATVLGVSATTIKEDWRMSRAWLRTQL